MENLLIVLQNKSFPVFRLEKLLTVTIEKCQFSNEYFFMLTLCLDLLFLRTIIVKKMTSFIQSRDKRHIVRNYLCFGDLKVQNK